MLIEVRYNHSLAEEKAGTKAKPFVVVGIPAYNEESLIARVVLEAQKYATTVVVCDDGSSDLTGKIAERLGADVVRHERNLGYGVAVRSLFDRARKLGADVLVTLDGDCQHDPAEIPSVLKPISEGVADVVIGSRFIDDRRPSQMPVYRRLGAKLITRMVNGSTKNGISDAQSGFRAYSKEALHRLSVSEAGMGASVEILMEARKNGLRIYEVPTSCKYHVEEAENSTENPVKHGIGVIMSVFRLIIEEKPLVVLGLPGILSMIGGIAFGVWMLQIYAMRNAIETNVALASLTFVVIGFFLLSSAITLYAISRLSKRIDGKKSSA